MWLARIITFTAGVSQLLFYDGPTPPDGISTTSCDTSLYPGRQNKRLYVARSCLTFRCNTKFKVIFPGTCQVQNSHDSITEEFLTLYLSWDTPTP